MVAEVGESDLEDRVSGVPEGGREKVVVLERESSESQATLYTRGHEAAKA